MTAVLLGLRRYRREGSRVVCHKLNSAYVYGVMHVVVPIPSESLRPSRLGTSIRTDIETTFRDLYPALRRFAAVVADADMDPDDLVQNALVSFVASPNRDVRHLNAYLRRSILNSMQDDRRTKARRRERPVDDVPDTRHVDALESDLTALLEYVPARDRALLFLLDVEGISTGEAGRLLHLSPTAVRTRASRARRAARSALTREETRNER